MSTKASETSQHERKKPTIEWIIGAVSGVVVVCLLGFLTYQAIFEDSMPPRLAVSIESVEPDEHGLVVRIAVRNSGDRAAAGVRVIAQVEGGIPREIEFDYVAGNEESRGVFMFGGNLDQREPVQVEIGGYTDP